MLHIKIGGIPGSTVNRMKNEEEGSALGTRKAAEVSCPSWLIVYCSFLLFHSAFQASLLHIHRL